jgi:hypothetical protein
MRTVAAKVRNSGFVTLSVGRVGDSSDANSYLDRVRAYVPVEVIAFFIFVNALVMGATLRTVAGGGPGTGVTVDGYVALIALIMGAVAAWLLTYVTSKVKNESRAASVQAVVSMFAFLVWSYAMGAKGYEVIAVPIVPSVAGLLLGAFTLFSGLVVPVKKEPSAAQLGAGNARHVRAKAN